jgi:predicted RND superfamily exporter protein
MLGRVLGWIGGVAVSRPGRLLLVLCLPLVALALYATQVPIDIAFTGILDRENEEVARYLEASRRLRFGGSLFLLLEGGSEEALDRAVEALQPALAEHEEVRAVVAGQSLRWLEEHAPWIVDRETFDLWTGLVTDPQDLQGALTLAARLGRLRADLGRLRIPGARLVEIKLRNDPVDVAVGDPVFFQLEERAREALAPHPVAHSFSGLPAIAAQDQVRTLGTIRVLSLVSLALVVLLFRVVERRAAGLLAVALAMLLAVAATLGLVGLLTGRLTIMEIFFSVTVFGLGIDFAVHLLVRLREERARGRGHVDALRTTLARTGLGVVAGGVTTAGAFFVVACAPDPVARHFGLSGGIGLVFCLSLMLTALPAAWVLMERRGRQARSVKPVTVVPAPLIGRLTRHAARHPRLHLAVAIGVLALALAGVPRFTANTSVRSLFNRGTPALQTVERVQELFHLNGAPWIVGAPDLEQARRLTRAFADHPRFVRAESAASLFPVDDPALRLAKLEAIAPRLRERIAQAGTDEQARALRLLERARVVGPPALDDLPAALREKLVAPNGELVVRAYCAEPTFDGLQGRAERLAAQAIHPEATALSALLEAVMVTRRGWVTPVLAGIALFVLLVLLVDLRDARLAAFALVPVAVGTVATFGLLCWAGLSFSVLTTIVVPLLLGVGVDDGIHVVHRMKEDPDLPADRAATSVGRAIFMTTATTCTSFLMLLFTDHPGLETMGLVMLVGLPLCLLASLSTLPAVAVLFNRRRDAA